MKRTVRIVLILVLAGLVVASGAALYIYQYGQADHAAPADVIIVLGGGVNRNGTPGSGHARRIRHAVTLYEKGFAPHILCTGGYDKPGWPKTEAVVCKELLIAAGVPEQAILMEEKSLSTEENVIESQRVMRDNGLKTALVVSDNFHILRSAMLFHDYNLSISTSPAQVTTGPLPLDVAVLSSYREVGAFCWQAFKSLLQLPVTRGPQKYAG